MSFAQERLWFIGKVEGGGPPYNISESWWLEGPLDARRLQGALRQVAQRHEVLRTAIVDGEGGPWQRVLPRVDLALPVVDLGRLPEAQARAEALRGAAALAQQEFDLAAPPLLRAALYRIDAARHLFVLALHPIVCDGWSMGVLRRDLARCYAGGGATLPRLPVQYADYALWQRGVLRGEVLQRQQASWRDPLAGLEPQQLPGNRTEPERSSHRGGRHGVRLAPELSAALRQLCRRERVTPFMLLLAAFQVLLSRRSGQDDVAIGCPVAGRSRGEFGDLIGCFVNTLVLRAHLGGNPSFRSLLGRVRDAALGAQAHQDLSVEQRVEDLDPPRDRRHGPLPDVVLNYLDTADEWDDLRLDGLSGRRIMTDAENAKFSLDLRVVNRGERIELDLLYQAARFSSEEAAELLNQLRRLLLQLIAALDRPVLEYSLVTHDARARLPDPAARLDTPPHWPVTALFSAQARSRPGATAVIQGGRRWTYQDLDEAARRLAGILVSRGMRRGSVVAILGERSFGLVSSMLAVLSGGAVFVTIDPALPAARQARMLGEAGALMVCRIGGAPLPTNPRGTAAPEVVVDVDPDEGVTDQAGGAPATTLSSLPGVEEGDAAYIFFTSGSTGQPKAVLGCHRGLSHFLAWQRERFAIGTSDRVAQLTSLSFDPLLRDVFLPLTAGASLCIPQPQDLVQPLDWLARHRVTVLHSVPTLIQSWLMHGQDGCDLGALRWLFLAGEPLTAGLVHAWRDRFPGAGRIVNLYGPTETTLAKCFQVVDGPRVPAVVPAGRPLPQTQAWVVNAAGQPCGIGEVGEVWLRTPFRTLGYLHEQRQAAQRFVPNPFRPADPGDLVYRTGDRGRYGPDGSLELLGRLDEQVKIRGVRIEPEEVRAALEEHPDVRGCFVQGLTDRHNGTILAAYVVREPGATVRPAALRSYLGRRLPAAMVPSAWEFLDALPRLASGKVDRKALSHPSAGEESVAAGAPTTPLERTLSRIFAELTGKSPVGLDDDFFALGGHSLLAMRLVARVRAETGQRVAAAEFMREPTVAGLAALLGATAGRTRIHPAIEPYRTADSPLFFAPGYDGHAHDARRLLAGLPSGLPVFGITAPAEAGASDDPVGSAASFCVDRIREVQPRGPYRIAGYSFGGKVAHAMACLLRDRGERVEHLFLIEPNSELFAPVPAPGQARPYGHRVFEGHAVLVRSWRQPLLQLSLPGLGWEHLCAGGLSIHDVPTTHWGLMAPPHAERTAAILAGHLGRAGGGSPGPDAFIAFEALPETFQRSRALAYSGRPTQAWELLQTLPPGTLPGWSLEFMLEVAKHAVASSAIQDAYAHACKLVRTHASHGLGLVEHLLAKGRGSAALTLLPQEGDPMPAGRPRETVELARALCAWNAGDAGFARRCLARVEDMLSGTPDRYVGVILALEAVRWRQPMSALFRRVLEQGSASARADVFVCLMEGCVQREDWTQAVAYGEAAVAAYPDVSAPYPNLIAALARVGRAASARRYHREATERFLGWGGFSAKLDSALAAHP